MHDVSCALMSWELTEVCQTQASLVCTHTDKSTHTIVVQFAAKAPAILCNLILTPGRSRAAQRGMVSTPSAWEWRLG